LAKKKKISLYRTAVTVSPPRSKEENDGPVLYTHVQLGKRLMKV